MTYQLVPAADITTVHADGEGQQYHSAITDLAAGGALVVFEQNVLRPDGLRDTEVTAQRYDTDGNPVGEPTATARR